MERSRSVTPLIISISVVLLIVVATFVSLKQCSQTTPKNTEASPTGSSDTKESVSENAVSKPEQKITENKGTEQPINLVENPKTPAQESDTKEIVENKNEPLADNEAAVTTTVTSFIAAISKLDPNTARQYVDPENVSYAKLAGLCIIFEEGDYKLADNRPVRKMFLKEDSAGWLARVDAKGSDQSAMFSISTKRKDTNSPWKITEISLDKLLADYAGKFSAGDIHYIPLIKNPKGGESLAIYFDLDSEALSSRTERQLDIVVNILKDDASKKLTISGHTDALGSDAHNLRLSKQRASQVMSYLIKKGVAKDQMKIIGYGKSLPRLPNTTADGQDAPDGRRANRRAEILLNF